MSFFRNKKVFDFTADNVTSVTIDSKDHSFLWKRMLPERWVLVTQGDSIAGGGFSLVMRHGSEGWEILHDHSSADPEE